MFDDVVFLEVQPPQAQAIVADMQAKVCLVIYTILTGVTVPLAGWERIVEWRHTSMWNRHINGLYCHEYWFCDQHSKVSHS